MYVVALMDRPRELTAIWMVIYIYKYIYIYLFAVKIPKGGNAASSYNTTILIKATLLRLNTKCSIARARTADSGARSIKKRKKKSAANRAYDNVNVRRA